MGSILVHCLDSSQSGCRYASGLIILVNLIMIGIEAEMSLQAGRTFRIFEICTSCIMLQNYITYIQLSICSVVGWLVIGSSCFDLCRDAEKKKAHDPRSESKPHLGGKELGPESWAYTIERIFLIIYCIEDTETTLFFLGLRMALHVLVIFGLWNQV